MIVSGWIESDGAVYLWASKLNIREAKLHDITDRNMVLKVEGKQINRGKYIKSHMIVLRDISIDKPTCKGARKFDGKLIARIPTASRTQESLDMLAARPIEKE